MSETNGPSRHVSYEQVRSIIDFMGQHMEFATGSLRSLEARHTSKRLWGELTKILNSCRGGTRKTSDGWSKYWSDFKNKLKNKAKLLKRKKSGSALKKGIRPLTKLEKRALVILGPHFQRKKTQMDVFSDTISNHLPPEVKLETYQENIANVYCKAQSDTSDRLSGGEDSNISEESSGEEYVEETDHNSNEPILQSLYPKWLIEVEKKRADAELMRAKADEQRVAVSAKSAEAALIQAEALKQLSEAAIKQADAIMRIAVALENRPKEDLLAI